MTKRCPWAKSDLDILYHDTEWGKPLHDDHKLFEMLILEGMQAGLSWALILKKRGAMRKAFDRFNPKIIARYDDAKLKELVQNPDIIRNRLKLAALKSNADAFMKVQKEFGTFDTYIWSFVNHQPIVNHFDAMTQIPTRTDISDRMSKDLKKRGFKFMGTTVCYAFMQATGMTNDHMTWCEKR